jgi:hypothetical protein
MAGIREMTNGIMFLRKYLIELVYWQQPPGQSYRCGMEQGSKSAKR